jgi:MoaA/NifB/PqqE/SkfB family radical SAM enzyme
MKSSILFKPDKLTFSLINAALFNRISRKWLLSFLENYINRQLAPGKNNAFSNGSPRILQERKMMALSILRSLDRAIGSKRLNPALSSDLISLWGKALGIPRNSSPAVRRFQAEHKSNPPWFLVISPTHACNLRCRDCYASSDESGNQLSWEMLQRVVNDARRLWDIKLLAFSGGEPFAYRAQDRGILDLVEQHPDILFLAFTNGTLIDRQTAARMAHLKNITPAISVEGMRSQTDARRGDGVFERALQSMGFLRSEGVPFGLSVTVNKNNHTEVLSDEFLDFFFQGQGVFYSFYFQYLPVGRNADFDLMPSAGQRVEFYRKIWRIIERKRLFLIDFWNHGPLAEGCIAAGRDGGYFHIDWNGNVTPCVFAPYSSGNLHSLYSKGQGLNDLWNAPFFRAIRQWQSEHGYGAGLPDETSNWLIPCPYRDHHKRFLEWIGLYSPQPEDAAAAEILADRAYHSKMAAYDEELAGLFDPVWRQEYIGK